LFSIVCFQEVVGAFSPVEEGFAVAASAVEAVVAAAAVGSSAFD
jgi:hypothetical protein